MKVFPRIRVSKTAAGASILYEYHAVRRRHLAVTTNWFMQRHRGPDYYWALVQKKNYSSNFAVAYLRHSESATFESHNCYQTPNWTKVKFPVKISDASLLIHVLLTRDYFVRTKRRRPLLVWAAGYLRRTKVLSAWWYIVFDREESCRRIWKLYGTRPVASVVKSRGLDWISISMEGCCTNPTHSDRHVLCPELLSQLIIFTYIRKTISVIWLSITLY